MKDYIRSNVLAVFEHNIFIAIYVIIKMMGSDEGEITVRHICSFL